MGKTGGSSWLTAVKRAFRSPTKDAEKKSCRRKTEHQDQREQEEEKKTEKRRWPFKKHSADVNEGKVVATDETVLASEHRHAIAVAAATAAAAEAAVATAKAAVEIIRLTQPTNAASFKQHSAAKLIQTAFRGYLARRALAALKGIVKLQALIRGQNVRKQANMTMKCMQSLLRVQARVRDQRARLSHDGGRRSMPGETNRSMYLKDIRNRRSMSRDGSWATDEWRDCASTFEELDDIVKTRTDAGSTRENSLAFAFSQQCDYKTTLLHCLLPLSFDPKGFKNISLFQNRIWDSNRNPYHEGENDLENRASYLDKWTKATKQWEISSRDSTDHRRDSFKTVEIDSEKTTSSYSSMNARKSNSQSLLHRQTIPHAAVSSHHRSPSLHSITQSPVTPPTVSKPRPPQVRSSSPRCLRDESSYSTANTPSLRSNNTVIPNYMASTESAKARIRSHSAPRQRPSTPDRDRGGGSAKKRLTYPIPDPYYGNFGFGSFNQNLRSPSFKSVKAGYVGMEQQSNHSCYTDSIGGELSPCSTTDLRRWLR
ncbi:protein IQ-DOMAIN 14-like [Dorcoceras hygrometricum]|uniref:Protein IQ-DOMAIN 14-like n=1 Tax=Dorcoceras hygrometricum TaxID=472368 RepID=A0A2Z7AKU8_9LAMI|nr:protein IQ-DOMAIN 14-like [Dorcoceras hygrometricum]